MGDYPGITESEAHLIAKKLKDEFIKYSINGWDFSNLADELDDFVDRTAVTHDPSEIEKLEAENRGLKDRTATIEDSLHKHYRAEFGLIPWKTPTGLCSVRLMP